jgi:hypothetical protein
MQTITLLVVLFWSETLSLTLKEKNRLRVSENSLLTIFRPKQDEMVGGWRELHAEELHDLYSSSNIIRMVK